MSDKTAGLYSLTAPVVMTFPNLFEAKAFKRGGKDVSEAKFSASFLFDPASPDLKGMKEAAARVAKAKWPNVALKDLKFPFASGDAQADKRQAKAGKSDGDFNRGKIVLSARSKYQPKLAVLEAGKVIDLENEAIQIANKAKFYSGVEVLAQFNFVAYESDLGSNGVTCYLGLVMTTNKGTKLTSAGPSASEVFKGYVGTISSEDPSAGMESDELASLIS